MTDRQQLLERLSREFVAHGLKQSEVRNKAEIRFAVRTPKTSSSTPPSTWYYQLFDKLEQQEKLAAFVDSFCEDYPFARSWLQDFYQLPAFRGSLQLAERNQPERANVHISSSAPANRDYSIAYLCDRTPQIQALERHLSNWREIEANQRQRPLVFVVYGANDACCSQFLEVLEKKKLLQSVHKYIDGELAPSDPPNPIDWPSEEPEWHLTNDLQDACPQPGARRFVLARTFITLRDWLKNGADTIRRWLAKMDEESWPMLRDNCLCHFLCIEYKKKVSPWARLFKRGGNHAVEPASVGAIAENNGIRYGGIFRILPELGLIEPRDVLNWLDMQEVKTRFSERQRQAIKDESNTQFAISPRGIAMQQFVDIVRHVDGGAITAVVPPRQLWKTFALGAVSTALLLVLGFSGYRAFAGKGVALDNQELATVVEKGKIPDEVRQRLADANIKISQYVEVEKIGRGYIVKDKQKKRWYAVHEDTWGVWRFSQRPRGKQRVLLIANNEYKDSSAWIPLQTPVKDAVRLGQILIDRYGFDEIHCLFESEMAIEEDRSQITKYGKASWHNIKNTLQKMANVAKPEDSLLIFYAGHGHRDGDSYYWVPHDAQGTDLQTLFDVATQDFVTLNKNYRHLLLICDACFSGSLTMRGEMAYGRMPGDFSTIEDSIDDSFYVFASGKANETVADSFRDGHSALGYFLCKLLEENDDKCLSGQLLCQQVADKVTKATGRRQNPTSIWHGDHQQSDKGYFPFYKDQ